MNRTLEPVIRQDLAKKMVLLTGPRQCGKTTLSKQLVTNYEYLNYDIDEDRWLFSTKQWNRATDLVIFDELHKMKAWKRWLKGVYDKEANQPNVLVTGSAQLDTYKKMGDSLAGRFFSMQLFPFDLKELKQVWPPYNDEHAFERLWHCSGFPEPFLEGDKTFYRRWRRSHIDIILRQDLIDLYAIRDIKDVETLILLLKTRVGSTVSYASLARDLQRDAKTVKRWLQLLENLYVVFKVTPYTKRLSRLIIKEPKYYFYDHTYASDKGAHLENIVALALHKALCYLRDIKGLDVALHYVRTKEGRELDFLIHIDNVVTHLIEVKWADHHFSKHFAYFSRYFSHAKKIQLVKELPRELSTTDGWQMKKLVTWLASFELSV